MKKEINALPLLTLNSGIAYDAPCPDNATVAEDDHAFKVMTDFTEIVPLTIEPEQGLFQALERMKEHGIRLLMVTDKQNNVSGIITAYDIQSEMPTKYTAKTGVPMHDITIGMLMTPLEKTPALGFNSLQQASAGQVAKTMEELDRPHILVIEENNGQRIRGIFSSSKVSRLLGHPVYRPLHAAHSLADLQRGIDSP